MMKRFRSEAWVIVLLASVASAVQYDETRDVVAKNDLLGRLYADFERFGGIQARLSVVDVDEGPYAPILASSVVPPLDEVRK